MKPINDNIQVELVSQAKQSASGILITEKAEEIRVVAVADSITDIKPGDHIEVRNGSIITVGDWMFVKEKDVLAIRGKS